jgi:hypothetical protein
VPSCSNPASIDLCKICEDSYLIVNCHERDCKNKCIIRKDLSSLLTAESITYKDLETKYSYNISNNNTSKRIKTKAISHKTSDVNHTPYTMTLSPSTAKCQLHNKSILCEKNDCKRLLLPYNKKLIEEYCDVSLGYIITGDLSSGSFQSIISNESNEHTTTLKRSLIFALIIASVVIIGTMTDMILQITNNDRSFHTAAIVLDIIIIIISIIMIIIKLYYGLQPFDESYVSHSRMIYSFQESLSHIPLSPQNLANINLKIKPKLSIIWKISRLVGWTPLLSKDQILCYIAHEVKKATIIKYKSTSRCHKCVHDKYRYLLMNELTQYINTSNSICCTCCRRTDSAISSHSNICII